MAFALSAFSFASFQMDGDLTVASPLFQPPVWQWPDAVMSYGIPAQAWDISNETQVVSAAPRPRGIKVNYK